MNGPGGENNLIQAVLSLDSYNRIGPTIQAMDSANPALELATFVEDVYHPVVLYHSDRRTPRFEWLSPQDIIYRTQSCWGERWADAHHPNKLQMFASLMVKGNFSDKPAVGVLAIEGRFAALDHHRVAAARLTKMSALFCEIEEVILRPQWRSVNKLLLRLKGAGVPIGLGGENGCSVGRWTFTPGDLERLCAMLVRGWVPDGLYNHEVNLGAWNKAVRVLMGKPTSPYRVAVDEWKFHEVALELFKENKCLKH